MKTYEIEYNFYGETKIMFILAEDAKKARKFAKEGKAMGCVVTSCKEVG